MADESRDRECCLAFFYADLSIVVSIDGEMDLWMAVDTVEVDVAIESIVDSTDVLIFEAAAVAWQSRSCTIVAEINANERMEIIDGTSCVCQPCARYHCIIF